MSKVLETRKERCRCGTEQKHIKEFAKYGWSFSSKQLLNRFGNPMPLDSQISEAEKREKCFYDLTFNRELERETIDKLNSLQNESESYKRKQSCFTGKRVSTCVFLTIVIIACLAIYFNKTAGENALIAVLACAVLALVGLSAIVVVGVFRVKKNCQYNDEMNKRKQQIEKEVQEILRKEQKTNDEKTA